MISSGILLSIIFPFLFYFARLLWRLWAVRLASALRHAARPELCRHAWRTTWAALIMPLLWKASHRSSAPNVSSGVESRQTAVMDLLLPDKIAQD